MLGATVGCGNYAGRALGWLGTEEAGDFIPVSVATIQRVLNEAGLTAAGQPLTVDGIWGPATRRAMDLFVQGRRGMRGESPGPYPATGARQMRLSRNAIAIMASVAPTAGRQLPATPWTQRDGATGKDFGTPPSAPPETSGSKDGGAPDLTATWDWGGAQPGPAGLPRWAWLAIALGGGALVIGGVVVAVSGKKRRGRAPAAPAMAANRRRRRRRR